MNDILIKLHELRDEYNTTRNPALLTRIIALKKDVDLSKLPTKLLKDIPIPFQRDFYATYPAYVHGLVSTTPHIEKYLEGCKLYRDIVEALKAGKDAEIGYDVPTCSWLIQLQVPEEFAKFIKATGHSVNGLLISPDGKGYPRNLRVMQYILNKKGWCATIHE